MRSSSRHRVGFPIVLAAAFLTAAVVIALAGCGPSASATPTGAPATAVLTPTPSSGPTTSGAAIPSDATGFAFDAESVVGYYRTQGYSCGSPEPSALAVDYRFTSCQLVDSAGRTRIVGVVTDPNDELADGFASVRGASTETILDPTVALDPLAGFLGAMLGQSRGESLLPWLASHLGDSFADTTIDALRVATYIKGSDHSTLYVEIANQEYLLAPRPSPS